MTGFGAEPYGPLVGFPFRRATVFQVDQSVDGIRLHQTKERCRRCRQIAQVGGPVGWKCVIDQQQNS